MIHSAELADNEIQQKAKHSGVRRLHCRSSPVAVVVVGVPVVAVECVAAVHAPFVPFAPSQAASSVLVEQ